MSRLFDIAPSGEHGPGIRCSSNGNDCSPRTKPRQPRPQSRLLSVCRRLPVAIAMCVGLSGLLIHAPANARVLMVGPDQALKTPSAAARVAHTGDTVVIEPKPGGYYDCAIWSQNDLTIEGRGGEVVITDTVCQGKALFIINGKDVRIQNLTFARARVRDGNGAGIRVQGRDLHIDHSKFVNNEVAILAGDLPRGALYITDSEFTDDGRCRARCTDAISIGRSVLLRVERSVFVTGTGRDQVRSGATLTELIGDRFTERAPGLQGHLVELPDGGSLEMTGNTIERIAASRDHDAMVLVAAGFGAQPTKKLTFTNNRITESDSAGGVFVRNWTGHSDQLSNNSIPRDIDEISGGGYYLFLAKSFAHRSVQAAKDMIRIPVALIRHL